jgi:serine/threonine protein kinase/uncharacterized protein YecT (DUF1311 family)
MHSETDFPPDLRALENHYELIRELGRGGMAAVYLARRRVSGKLVAIKAVRGRYLDDPDTLQRFAREARTVADLSHPHIVRTEAIEEIGDRAVAIIMEYLTGGTVRDRLREHGAFSAENAETVLRDVAQALGYAHDRGIVHRDVKPENVFLDEHTGRALLSDFGIARRIEGDVAITMLGTSLGTPQYMSPEQIDGRAVDGRTDIYSLGVLGWELLTGLRPWAGETVYGVIYKQKHEELPRVTSLRPRLPANLLFAIEGALVKDRDRRWQSADEFLEQLTYSPPPVLSQRPSDSARTVHDEPTVRFRRPAMASGAEPNANAERGSQGGSGAKRVIASPEVARRDGTAQRPKAQRQCRRAVWGLLVAVAVLTIAGLSWYALLGGRGPVAARADSPGAVRTDSADDSADKVTSSAGSIALDTPPPKPARPVGDSGAGSRRRTRPRPAAAPMTPKGSTGTPRTSPVATGPSARCSLPSMADQRACLMAYVTINDASLQRVYDSLIVEMRRNASVKRGDRDPAAVMRLRQEQRQWIAVRDRECTRDPAPGYTPLWAEPVSKCFARMSAARRGELARELGRATREPR